MKYLYYIGHLEKLSQIFIIDPTECMCKYVTIFLYSGSIKPVIMATTLDFKIDLNKYIILTKKEHKQIIKTIKSRDRECVNLVIEILKAHGEKQNYPHR